MSPLLLSGDTDEVVHYTWYANETEKILSCSMGGVPVPTFHWEKENKVGLKLKPEKNIAEIIFFSFGSQFQQTRTTTTCSPQM